MTLPVSRFVEFANTASSSALNLTTTLGDSFKLVSVRVKFSAAPTTSELLIVSVDSKVSSSHDAVLYSLNPSLDAVTSIWWTPSDEFAQDVFVQGNHINVSFTNTNARTIGCVITLERIN